jgi:hypothetical protein
MFSVSKAILSAVLTSGVLGLPGGTLPALASDHNGQDHTYGGPVQTWCDINPDCNGWNKGLHRSSYDGSISAPVASPSPRQHPARKHGRDAGSR